MAAPSLSTSTDMGFRGYEFVDAFTIPHAHYVHALSVSPGGRWVLSSSSGPAGNAIVIADSRNLSQHGHYTFPSKWITCVSWVSDDLFFAGFSDGTTYVGKIEGGEENAGYFEFALDLTPIRIAGLSSQGPITAITHHALGGGYLAVANARQIVLARGSRNPDSTNNLNFVGLEPFEDPRSSITGLLFSSHGAGGLKLIVCATGGFIIFSINEGRLRSIFRHDGYQIGCGAVSDDGEYLVFSTLSHQLVYIKLGVSGVPVCFIHDLLSNPGRGAPPVAFTPTDGLVGGSSAGHLHYFWKGNRAIIVCNEAHEFRAVATRGRRVYIVAVSRVGPDRTTIVCYTRRELGLN